MAFRVAYACTPLEARLTKEKRKKIANWKYNNTELISPELFGGKSDDGTRAARPQLIDNGVS